MLDYKRLPKPRPLVLSLSEENKLAMAHAGALQGQEPRALHEMGADLKGLDWDGYEARVKAANAARRSQQQQGG